MMTAWVFYRRPGNEIGYVNYDESFHRSVADLSGNKRITAVASDLIQQFQRVVRVLAISFIHEAVRRDHSEHEAIIDAIQAHDADRAFDLPASIRKVHASAS
jgi:DNA-binding GntR family transcriptional regulator